MKKNIMAFLFFMIASNNVIASDLKIGFVSVEQLLAQAPQVEAVNTAMTARFADKQDELQALESEIKKMQEDFKRNELVMTEDKLKELAGKVQAKYQEFQQKKASLGKEVTTMRNQELAKLQKAIRAIIDDLAKNGNYDLILTEGVVHANEKINITENVLAEMKKSFEASSKE